MICFKKFSALRAPIFFNGGDVHENRHFIEGKLVAHGQFLVGSLVGGDIFEFHSDFKMINQRISDFKIRESLILKSENL